MNDFEAKELATKRKPLIRFGLLEGIILFLIVCAIGGIVIPNRTSTGSPAPRTHMISQLKQVGLASLMYMSDWDDRLPFAEPYEFPVDPIGPYLRDDALHVNIFADQRGQHRLPRTTQHEFRFVQAPLTLESGAWVRKIIEVQASPKPQEMTLLWSEAGTDKPGVVVAYADGHVKFDFLDALDEKRSPGPLDLDFIPFGRTTYIHKGAQWPPPTFSVPANDVNAFREHAMFGKKTRP